MKGAIARAKNFVVEKAVDRLEEFYHEIFDRKEVPLMALKYIETLKLATKYIRNSKIWL